MIALNIAAAVVLISGTYDSLGNDITVLAPCCECTIWIIPLSDTYEASEE